MCKNATKTAAALLAGIEPTLVAFLNLENISADQKAAVIAAYDAAQKAVAAWTPGTSGQVAVEAVQALNSVFQTLPVPDVDKVYAGLITAGLTSVIAIIEANSTTNVLEQHAITAKAVTDVNAMAPGAFKYHKGVFAVFQDSPAEAYHNAWNKQVEASTKTDSKYQTLMVD